MFGLGKSSKKTKKQSARPTTATAGDLLSQISAEDVAEEQRQKQKRDETPLSTRIFVMLMKGVFVFDGYSRKYKPIFKISAFLWGFFISLVYAGGILALAVVGYSYVRFPALVRQYFEENNMTVDSLKMQDYNFSHIEVSGIQDIEKTYQINQMNIRSSFSDFLRKKVKLVSLNDATIQIQETQDGLNLGGLLKFLINLNTRTDVSVANASVKVGTLVVSGENYRFPIQFSMTGQYDNKANIRIPISIKENALSLNGILSVMGSPASLDWQFEVLLGTVTFPNQHAENVTGRLSFKTKDMHLSEIKGDITLAYEKNTRKVIVDLKRNGELFTGKVNLSLETKNVKDNSKNIKSDIVFDFKGLDVRSFTHQETKAPVHVKINSLTTDHYEFNNVETTLKGNLVCHLGSCRYDLEEPSAVVMRNTTLKRATETFVSSAPITFMLMPQSEFFTFENQQIGLHLAMKDFKFEGYRNQKDVHLMIAAENISLEGYPFGGDERALHLTANNFDYDSPEVTLLQTDMIVDDLKKAVPQWSLNSASVQLKNSLTIKKPFSLRFQTENKLTKAQATILDTNIQVNFSGLADLSLPEFKGTIYIPPFNLNTFEHLTDLSDLFVGTLNNVSGDMSLYGNVHWRSEKQVTGPLFLALKNLQFERGNIAVKNLNTVISLQSLVPFISQPAQSVFVSEVQGPISMQNILASVKFDTQLIRIPSLKGYVAGVPVYMDSTVVPYKTSGMTVYFKNPSVEWDQMPQVLKTQELALSGTGTLSLPIEIKDNIFNLRNGEAKFVNTKIKYTGNNKTIREKILSKGNKYHVTNGNFILNTKEGDLVDIYMNLEGYTEPRLEKFQVKTNDSFHFTDIFGLMPEANIPEEITQKQDLMIQ